MSDKSTKTSIITEMLQSTCKKYLETLAKLSRKSETIKSAKDHKNKIPKSKNHKFLEKEFYLDKIKV